MQRQNRPVRMCHVYTSDESWGQCAKNYPNAYFNASYYPPGLFSKKYNLCCPTEADYEAGIEAMHWSDKTLAVAACVPILKNAIGLCSYYVPGAEK
jgi:hypothetical protein